MSATRIVYFNVDTFSVCTSTNGSASIPRATYRESVTFEIHFVRFSENNILTAVDVSSCVSWEAAIDNIMGSATDPMAKAIDSDIDDSLASTGIITVHIDCDTLVFQAKIATSRYINAYFCLKGFNSEADIEEITIFDIYAQGIVDPADMDPDPASPNYPTFAQMYAAMRAGRTIEFSTDGITGWHSTQDIANDDYWAESYPEGERSSPIYIPRGATGAVGVTGANSIIPGPTGATGIGTTGITGATGEGGSVVTGIEIINDDFLFTNGDGSTFALEDAVILLSGATGVTGADSEVPGPTGVTGDPGAEISGVTVSGSDFIFAKTDGSTFALTDAMVLLKGDTGADSTVAGPTGATGEGESLPDQAGHTGEFLFTNGSTAGWTAVQGGGVSTLVTITGATYAITSSDNGKILTNAGSTQDCVMTFDDVVSLTDFEVEIVNENGYLFDFSSLTAAYKFNTGNLTTDSIGSNTLTLVNTPAEADGITGNALGLVSASKQYAYKDSALTAFQPTTNVLSISCWIYLPTLGGASELFIVDTSGTDYPFRMEILNNKLWIAICTNSNANINGGSATLSAEQWTHVAMTTDGTNLRSYVNGVLDGGPTSYGNANLQTITKLWIGSHNSLDTRCFNGRIDEFYFFKNRTLSASEIATLYAYGSGIFYTGTDTAITLAPHSGQQLPGTSAADRLLKSSAKNDYIKLRTTDSGIIATGVYPSSINWVDTAP